MKKNYILSLIFILPFILSSCLTYYEQNIEFYRNFEQGNFMVAKNNLEKVKKGPTGRNKLLYHLNMGTVSSLMGQYEESNQYFEQAYLIGENYKTNYLAEAASFLTNPNVTEYRGEDFEHLLLHYYKALNFLKMNDYEAALVECRRMNIKLNAFGDKYTADWKYKRDAFIHTLMGIIYEANGDMNNAFIAYRNALEIYEEDYIKFFGMSAPKQLKKDLLRTAYKNGFMEDLRRYEEQFEMKYDPSEEAEGTLIFLWHNGLAPVKTEASFEFNVGAGRNGGCVIRNRDMGLEYSYTASQIRNNGGNLADISAFKIAFPEYIERPPLFSEADIIWNNNYYKLQLAEDVNKIALKTLRQRFLKELGKALLRVAIKKAGEEALRAADKDGAAAVLNIFNTITEQADTRGWKSIPHSIYYVRVPLPAGEQTIQFNMRSTRGSNRSYEFTFEIPKGKTIFHTFHALQTL